ncbi:hypothetical protein ACWD5F_42215 [Streptomyces sp. NPDC002499]
MFAPLWAILELGAVRDAGVRPLRDVSLTDFVAGRRDKVDRLLQLVRDIGDFSDETMSIFERQGGWNDNCEVTAEYLMMYSGCIETYPPDTDDPVVRRRMLDMGSDLQSVTLLHALVGTAAVRGPGLATAPRLIVSAVRMAGSLVGADGDRVVADVFRMWRVAFLPDLLRPNAPTRAGAKESLRDYAHELGRLTEEQG